MRRTRVTYMPGSGVEPGRDGRRDNGRDERYESTEYSREPRRDRDYDRRGWEVRPIGFERDPFARRYGMVNMMDGGHRSGEYENGRADYDRDDCLSWDEAKQWLKKIRNADGSTGAHWNIDQTSGIMDKLNIACDECEFWVAMNMLYSDYCGVAKKYGVDNADFFACLAAAFLNDEDAVDDKLTAYYDYIVEH